MLGADVGFGMLVAAVASVLPPIVGLMEGGACGIVITIEHEECRVIECAWFPSILAVALLASSCCAAMDSGRGSDMTGRAILANRRVQQRM